MQPFDIRANSGKFFFQPFEAAIQMIDPVDDGFAFGCEARKHKARRCPQIGRHHLGALEPRHAPHHGEIAFNLYRLYEYMNWRLIQANIKRDGKMVLEVQNRLRDLRETWAEAIKIQASQAAGTGVA